MNTKLNTMSEFITLREEFENETGAHVFADQQYIQWLEKLVERLRQEKTYPENSKVKEL